MIVLFIREGCNGKYKL